MGCVVALHKAARKKKDLQTMHCNVRVNKHIYLAWRGKLNQSVCSCLAEQTHKRSEHDIERVQKASTTLVLKDN